MTRTRFAIIAVVLLLPDGLAGLLARRRKDPVEADDG